MADKSNNVFVNAVVKDPANPPQVRLVVGYLGNSETAGQTRIYANPELSEHIDVPDAAILHTLDVPNDPLGAKYVWIQKDAQVTRRDKNQTETKSKFLSGPLTAGAAPAAAAAAPQQVPSVNLPCIPRTEMPNSCPSDLGICPSIDIACVSLPPVHCPPQPTVHILLCHTKVPLLCPGNSLGIANCPPRSALIPCVSQGIICPGGPGRSAVDACNSALLCGTLGITFNPLM
jgi:hypothetical protein